MLGIVFPGDRETALVTFPDPTPGPGEVIVEMKASGMCGSDLHLYRQPKGGTSVSAAMSKNTEDPATLIRGHEPCGIVAAVGAGVSERLARVGQRVMVHHYWGCAVCGECRTGWTQLCENEAPKMYGTNAHGSHAHYFKVPAQTILPLPDELSFEAGAAIGCGSGTSYGALKRLRMDGGGTIAVFGQGPVGLAGTQFAKAMGARVIALDISDERLAMAKKFGADEIINPAKDDAVSALKDLTHGRGTDAALETSGAVSARLEAIKGLKRWGTGAFVGIGAPTPIDINLDMILRQVTIFGSVTFSAPWQEECARFAVDHKIDVDGIFTHRWALEQADEAYKLLDQQACGKGVFVM